jgi:glycosidase
MLKRAIWSSLLAGAVAIAGCGTNPMGWLGGSASGMHASKAKAGNVSTPDWAKNAVFYQIFPERFCNGDPSNDPQGVQPWGGTPTFNNFMGGDLQGVTQKLPYLKQLGVTALYFNPIFTSSSNHKYNTGDYMHVDPHFGGDAAFHTMLQTAHSLGLKVILDGVFNHTGDDNAMFVDCKTNGQKSPFWGWYHIFGFPIVTSPQPNYDSWWGFGTLPKLMVASNPDVQNYIYSVEEKWLKEGIDGWRLDVPNEIASDDFWRGFRSRAKAINPNAYIVGEIWTDASHWLQGDQFDSVMNYVWRGNVDNFFANQTMNVDQLDQALLGQLNEYDPQISQVMFNIMDSHDVPRFLTDCGGDTAKQKLAVLFQMTFPGTPVVYYGDEIGMQGAKDPDNRRCYEWNPANQNRDVQNFYKTVIALRNQNAALRTGTFRSFLRHNDFNLYAYVRELGASKIAVMLNNSNQVRDWNLDVSSVFPNGTTVTDPLARQTYTVANGTVALHLNPKQGVVLMPTATKRR